MKKSLLIGAATLAVTVMVGTGFGSASSQDVKGESTPAVEATPATKATAEEIAAFEKEAEGTPAGELTSSTEAAKK